MCECEECKVNSLSNYGINVFNDSVMQDRLPRKSYKEMIRTLNEGSPLTEELADVVANAMKDWAVEKGATHYTHWFQPLTSLTAEKHDSFLNPRDGVSMLYEFSGKELVKGEPDASSFPSGGIRATFEARGYTAWDCTSPAFLKDDGGVLTLCIPTAFYSYTGEALDKKTPLLRSMQCINENALRVLKIFGNETATKVTSTVGPEQEYFLIDKSFYQERLDLITCGRTLFGAPSPKGQELEDQYFGSIKERIACYMNEVDASLWEMGVPAKTRHNEVAPAQYELAVVFETTNVATDHNQLVMDVLRKTAERHDLVCLLHEKPFAGINGSGKHNNWSMATDDGQNLLEPGKTPHQNLQFLVFLCAVLAAVDRYALLLRASAANTGNDHRLGANEAPPAIISVFLGDQLTEILEGIEKGVFKAAKVIDELKINVKTLPNIPMDNTDRNRTSPFAFTGNKFEFRMVGSSASTAGPNVVLNTIVATTLGEIAEVLEKAGKDKLDSAIQDILVKLIKAHKRIIFNGNNYSAEWVIEAEKRGLPNIRNTVDALKAYVISENIKIFEKFKVLSKKELHSRYEVYIENYVKHINIEALTMIDMLNRQIIPAVGNYLQDQIGLLASIESAGLKNEKLKAKVKDLNDNLNKLLEKTDILQVVVKKAHEISDLDKKAEAYRDSVFGSFGEIRAVADYLETKVALDFWPIPTYAEMLFLSN